jgi:hypothetical protein
MIESPVIKELLAEKLAESKREDLILVLECRFGEIPQDVSKRLRKLRSEKRLADLFKFALRCPDLATFRTELFS